MGSRINADSLDEADTADVGSAGGGVDLNSAAYGQSLNDIAAGSSSGHRSLSSFADGDGRALAAFWEDSRVDPNPRGAPAAQAGGQRGLIESLQYAAAALSSERDDIAASQRLAERFARQPVQVPWQPPVRRPAPGVRPYMVMGAFLVLIGGGAAIYLLESGGASRRAPDGSVNAAAIAPSAEDALDSADERNSSASRALVPSQAIASRGALSEDSGESPPVPNSTAAGNRQPAPDSDHTVVRSLQPAPDRAASSGWQPAVAPERAASWQAVPAPERAASLQAAPVPDRPAQSWDSTVETLRLLSNAQSGGQKKKAAQPDNAQRMLLQLETWRNAGKSQ